MMKSLSLLLLFVAPARATDGGITILAEHSGTGCTKRM
jgi:hypothetical protein